MFGFRSVVLTSLAITCVSFNVRAEEPAIELKPEPISALNVTAKIPAGGDWMGVAFDSVWLASGGILNRGDLATDTVTAKIPVGGGPYKGIATGEGAVFVPACGNQTVYRIDPTSNEVTALKQLPFSGSEASVGVGAGSVWIVTNEPGAEHGKTLSRLDAKTLEVQTKIAIPSPGDGVVFEAGFVYVTSASGDLVVRVDASSNTVAGTIAAHDSPRFITSGEGQVWWLNQGDGSVQRVDAATGEVVAVIDAKLAGGGGDIAYGEAAIWITMPGVPVAKIDVHTNTVVRRFEGYGMGDAIRAGYGSVFVSGGSIHRISAP